MVAVKYYVIFTSHTPLASPYSLHRVKATRGTIMPIETGWKTSAYFQNLPIPGLTKYFPEI